MLQPALQPCAHACDLHCAQVEVQALHITRRDLPDADASPEQWQTLMGTPIDTPKQNNFIMLCDPSFSQVPDLISGGHLQVAPPNSHQLLLNYADLSSWVVKVQGWLPPIEQAAHCSLAMHGTGTTSVTGTACYLYLAALRDLCSESPVLSPTFKCMPHSVCCCLCCATRLL